MANENRAISKQKPLDTELWYVEMFAERGPAFKSFVHRCNVEDSQLWFQFPKAPLIISIVGPRVVRAGDAKGHEASTTVNPGTEAGLSPAGRPAKRVRSGDEHPAFQSNYTPNDKHVSHHAAHMGYGGIVNNSIRDASKMNGPTGPRQQMPNVARTGPGITDTSRYKGSQAAERTAQLLQERYGTGFRGRPTEPVPRAGVTMNDPTGPRQPMPKVARTGPGTTDPSWYTVPPFPWNDAKFCKMVQEQHAHMANNKPTVPQSVEDRYKEYFWKNRQSTEDKNKPKKPVPKADAPGPNGTL